MARHLLYFADPMCSWCWGFSPTMQRLIDAYGETLPIRIIVGGLRPGTTTPMDDRMKQDIRSHWEHVHEASEQPFDFDFFARDGFVYDTEPACRAVVSARRLDESKALAFMKVVQRSFYAENIDVSDVDNLVRIATDNGYDGARFREEFLGDEARAETQADFQFSQQCGVTGFPTVLGVKDEAGAIITIGFRHWENIQQALDSWLTEGDEPGEKS